MSHIFISYSHKDADYAKKLAVKLQSEGFDVWVDVRLDYGSQWPLEIQQQLDSCTAFILLMSARSFASDWVQSELSRAKRKKKPVFPLLLDGNEPWLSVESIQYFDVQDGSLPDDKFYTALARVVPRGQQQNQTPEKTAAIKPASTPKYRTGIIVAILVGITTLIAATIPIIRSNLSPSPSPSPVPTSTVLVPSATARVEQTETLVPKFTSVPVPSIYGFQACPLACNGQNSTNNFAAGITKIFFQFNYENFKPGIPYSRTWTMGGREWIRYTCKWDGPSSGTELLKLTEPKGLASGTWEIKITVDNNVLLEEEIVVVGNGNYWDPAGVINACHGTN